MTLSRRHVLLGSAGLAAAGATSLTIPVSAQAASGDLSDQLLVGVVFEDAALAETRIRFRTGTGSSLGWIPVRRSAHARDGWSSRSSELLAIPAGAVQVELDELSSGRARLVTLNGKNSPFALLRSPRSVSASAPVKVAGVPVVTRSAWGADESLMTWPSEFSRAQVLTVHHSAGAATGDRAAVVRAIYRYHAVDNQWGDIGYQLLIGRDGQLFAGRSTGQDSQPVFKNAPSSGTIAESVTGAHSGGFNTGNIGICVLGDYTSTLPGTESMKTLIDVLAGLCRTLGLDPLGSIQYRNPVSGATKNAKSISRHRDWNSTECPGNLFAGTFDELRAKVAARMAAQG